MNRIKYALCFLLVIGVLFSVCACSISVNQPTETISHETPAETTGTETTTEPASTEAPTEPTDAETPTDPTQEQTEPTDPVVTENPVGIYRCVAVCFDEETGYQESPAGYGIDIYDDGTAMLYVGDFIYDLRWNVEGKRFTGTTMDESNLPMEGTIDGDKLELTFDGAGLRFEKKSQQELGDEAVDFLRDMMEDTPQQFAVAYLGWIEPGENLQDWITQNCPLLISTEPYISLIPQERVFGTSGEVYCVVPNDPNMNVTIKLLQDVPNVEDMVKEVLFEGTMGEPFLVIANSGDFYQDTQVIFTNSEGNQTLWYPMTGQYYTAHIPDNEDGELLGYDFSFYSEVYPYGYNLWMRDGWDWVTEDFMTKTVWSRYFEVVEGDAYTGYNWYMNLSDDGTGEICLTNADMTENYATYTGTWQVTELDVYSGLLLNMTCTENYAPMELPNVISDEYVILGATDMDNIVLGIREGQASNPVVAGEDDYCFVWYGAVG